MNKNQSSPRLQKYVTEINVAYYLLTEDGEPSTFHKALNSSDVALWMTAMQEEIEAFHKNKTWELVPLPHRRKFIGKNGSTRSNVIAMTKWSSIVRDWW